MADRPDDNVKGSAHNAENPQEHTPTPIQVSPELGDILMAFEANLSTRTVETVSKGTMAETFARIRSDIRNRREALS